VLFVLSLLLVSCAPQEPDMAAFRNLVEEYNAVVADGMLSGNNEKVWPYYGDDAIQMPSNSPVLNGKDAIMNYSDEMAKSGMKFTSVKFDIAEVGGSGMIAYEIGTYEMSLELGPTKIDDNGKYMTLWKKQADGSWKLYAEIWNSSVPMPS